ncbi:hypothetical protein KR009_006678, partial [Drosophila setifemur]
MLDLLGFALAILILPDQSRGELLEEGCGVRSSGWRTASSPWMAQIRNQTSYLCGGSLINRRNFIFKWKSYANKPFLTSIVRLGEYTRRDCSIGSCNPPAQEYSVERSMSHESFSENEIPHDIALLKLRNNISYGVHIRPICIHMDPRVKPQMDMRQDLTFTGWGDTNDNGQPHVLKAVDVQRQDIGKCKKNIYGLTESQICAGDETHTICGGDSGGPLGAEFTYRGVARFTQVGIICCGIDPCQGPSIFTDVMSYVDWIKRKITDD